MLHKKLFYLLLLVSFSCINGMSRTKTIVPIIAALRIAEEKFLNQDQWYTVNENQKLLVEKYLPYASDLVKLSPEELKCCASYDINEVNVFLKENKFGIQLAPMDDSYAFDVASIMNILCKWKWAGDSDHIIYKKKVYPAVKMENEWENQGYTITVAENYSEPIVHIEMQNGDTASLVIADRERNSFDLLQMIEKINSANKKEVTEKYKDITFPMVDLNHQPDISWLQHMSKPNNKKGERMFINQALQQTKFQMDEKGAQTQSVVAISMCYDSYFASIKPSLTINKPFFVWITREGMNVPLFAGYIHPNDWKKPVRD